MVPHLLSRPYHKASDRDRSESRKIAGIDGISVSVRLPDPTGSRQAVFLATHCSEHPRCGRAHSLSGGAGMIVSCRSTRLVCRPVRSGRAGSPAPGRRRGQVGHPSRWREAAATLGQRTRHDDLRPDPRHVAGNLPCRGDAATRHAGEGRRLHHLWTRHRAFLGGHRPYGRPFAAVSLGRGVASGPACRALSDCAMPGGDGAPLSGG